MAARTGRRCGRTIGDDRGRSRRGLARSGPGKSPPHGPGRWRPRGDRARAGIRAGPCRQHPRARPRRPVARPRHLPGPGPLCPAMGRQRERPSVPRGRREAAPTQTTPAPPRPPAPAAPRPPTFLVHVHVCLTFGPHESGRPGAEGWSQAPPAEFHRALEGLAVRPLGFPDSYAPMAGHAGGWPIGYEPAGGRAWLAHCYGMVGVGRDVSPDTGTGGELYAVIGHAPRHLDRNIATVGRVLSGIEHMTPRPRGTEALGFSKEAAQHTPTPRPPLPADLPAGPRPT